MRYIAVRGMKIPDEDVVGWIDTFRDAGLSQDEVDEIMVRMNDTWARKKMGSEIELVGQFTDRVLKLWLEKLLSKPAIHSYIEKGILEGFRHKTKEDLEITLRIVQNLMALDDVEFRKQIEELTQ